MPGHLLCFYGSLRPGAEALDSLKIRDRLIWRGACRLRGALFDLGEYPGLRPGDQSIDAEICEVADDETLAILDDWEDFFPHDLASSLYLRLPTRIDGLGLTAQVYWYNGTPSPKQRVPSGCWIEWRRLRG